MTSTNNHPITINIGLDNKIWFHHPLTGQWDRDVDEFTFIPFPYLSKFKRVSDGQLIYKFEKETFTNERLTCSPIYTELKIKRKDGELEVSVYGEYRPLNEYKNPDIITTTIDFTSKKFEVVLESNHASIQVGHSIDISQFFK